MQDAENDKNQLQLQLGDMSASCGPPTPVTEALKVMECLVQDRTGPQVNTSLSANLPFFKL